MLDMMKRRKVQLATLSLMAFVWLQTAAHALTLDGSETPAEVFNEVWNENKAYVFALLGAIFGVSILVALIKRGLRRGQQAATRI